MEQSDLNKALAKAKIGLMTKEGTVFWSTVCMGLNHHFDDAVPTAGTNGLDIKYNRDFFMNGCKSNEERTGLVYHELGHVVLQHIHRRGSRDPQLYNIAGDHVINIMGHDAGFVFPSKPCMDFKYRDWSTEQIYDDLVQDPPPDASDFEPDVDFDNPAGNEEEVQAEIDDLLVKGVMAADQADQAGSVPNEVRRHVNSLLHPVIPWDNILQRYMVRFDKTKYNYKTPNRRFFPGMFLPKRKNKALGKIAMAVDASASVTDREFEVYVSGAHTVLKRYKPEALEFMQFTTRITARQDIKTVEELMKIEFMGKGGTSVAPVMAWAKEAKPALLIIFSDGEFPTPQINPKIPVVWIIHHNKDFTAPFGKVIHFNIPT